MDSSQGAVRQSCLVSGFVSCELRGSGILSRNLAEVFSGTPFIGAVPGVHEALWLLDIVLGSC